MAVILFIKISIITCFINFFSFLDYETLSSMFYFYYHYGILKGKLIANVADDYDDYTKTLLVTANTTQYTLDKHLENELSDQPLNITG